MKAPFTQCMMHVRTTPGTYRYDSTRKNSPAPLIYIKKSLMGADPPRRIRLTIEAK